MTEKEQAAVDRQTEMVRDLYANLTDGVTLAEKAKRIAQVIFATGHNEDLPQNRMIESLLILSGSAVAILYQCAKALEERDES